MVSLHLSPHDRHLNYWKLTSLLTRRMHRSRVCSSSTRNTGCRSRHWGHDSSSLCSRRSQRQRLRGPTNRSIHRGWCRGSLKKVAGSLSSSLLTLPASTLAGSRSSPSDPMPSSLLSDSSLADSLLPKLYESFPPSLHPHIGITKNQVQEREWVHIPNLHVASLS